MNIAKSAKKESHDVINKACGHGIIGKAGKKINNAARALLQHGDEFSLKGENAQEKFADTVKKFGKGGVGAGAIVSKTIMFPYDLLVGGGGHHTRSCPTQKFFDNGCAGYLLKGTTTVCSSAIGGLGGGVGGLSGIVSSGVQNAADGSTFKKCVESGVEAGAQMGIEGTSSVLGATSGVALNIIRIPSLLVKYTVTGVFGLGGVIVGTVAGTGRAIAHVTKKKKASK